MPNFILAGERRDAVIEANHCHQSGQHLWAQAEELAEQMESSEKHHSLTLVEREYSYKGLKSWWQNIERQINQCASDYKQTNDCHNGTANHEPTPKDAGSELQESQLEEPMDVVRGGEALVQASESVLDESTNSGRRSMATPEALFLAEKLQQLADTTRQMAQHLLSPEAVKSRRVAGALGVTLDAEDGSGSRDLEFVRHKILLLDDVVEELSQYRMTPLAFDMTDRSVGELSESECQRNESAATCDNTIVESTNVDSADFQQELDTSNSDTSLEVDMQSTVPYTTEGLNMWFDSVPIADKEVLSAAASTEQGSENSDVSETSADDDPPSQHFPAEVTISEPRTSPGQLLQREPQTCSPGTHLVACTSDHSPQQLRFSTCHWKEAADIAQRVRRSVSKRDRLDRVTTTALRLLSYPILRHALREVETHTSGEDTFASQKMPLHVVQHNVAPSGSALPQQAAQMNSSSSRLDTSASHLFSQEYGSQQEASKPGGIDGMIALAQRLLKLQIMGQA